MHEYRIYLNLIRIRQIGPLTGEQDHLLDEVIKEMREEYYDRTDSDLDADAFKYERTMTHG